MQQFILDLKDDQRPIIKLEKWKNMNALLDTGAVFPVWLAKEELLVKLGATLKKENITFGGFKEKAVGNLYILPSFVLGALVFPNFHIIACENDRIPAHMIVSATMFRNLSYEINDKTKHLTVTIPDGESNIRNLVIKSTDGISYVFCNSAE